jgi:tetratricopeptide (TPR) repeat protein
VLVVDGLVKVLDFGLSVITSRTVREITQTTAGTFAYMAPELFAGAPVTRASDLYAIGVMAYELFAGRFPYNNANMAVLISDILTKAVDVRSIGVSDELAAVLDRLLVKTQGERYRDAGEVMRDLCAAAGCSLPPETTEIRESFLQAARFTGRVTELARLLEALDATLAGRGSAWLVGGESGVGKSRLADELRTLALVKGATVLRGQATGEGGSPYHLWREALRWLALTTHLERKEASVLKPLVPDIGDLVGFEVPDVPSPDPQGTQMRLLSVVEEVFKRQERPMMVILEDLQWAGSESLALLDRLKQGVVELPLLLIGNYRDDECPHLPDALPGMEVLKLERLSKEGIADLSESMVGAVGRDPQVVGLLQRETEGNPFFLVEVVRALAEKVGRLEDVGRMALPEKVFAGGVQEVIQRRLSQVAVETRPLLQLAAIAGRELDLDVLQAIAPKEDLRGWLTACTDAAVLEVGGGQWRFAHHKLRDGVLDALPDGARSGLHRRVAEAIESVYPGANEQVATLAHHWEWAGETERAIPYLRRAGEQAAAQFANVEAIAYFSRALDLTPEGLDSERYALLLVREDVYRLQGEREAQRDDLVALMELAEILNDDRKRAKAVLRWSNYAIVTSDYPAAIAAAQASIHWGEVARDVRIEAEGYLRWGVALWQQGDYEAARARLEQGLALAQATQSRPAEADGLRNLGHVSYEQSDYARARGYYQQSLRISREMGDRRGENSVLDSLGSVFLDQGNYAGARDYYQQSLCISREIGDRRAEGIVLNNLGLVFVRLGDYAEAKVCYEQGLRICYEIDDRRGEGEVLVNLSLLFHHRGEDEVAREYGQQTLTIARELGDRHNQGYALTFLGHALTGMEHLAEAADAYRQALTLRRALGQPSLAMEPLAGLAHVSLARGDLSGAQTQVDKILIHLETHTLDGTEEPFWVYLTCYHVLRSNQDPRAQVILNRAHSLLQERAAKIEDEDLRRSFLENVASHREIEEAFQSRESHSGECIE